MNAHENESEQRRFAALQLIAHWQYHYRDSGSAQLEGALNALVRGSVTDSASPEIVFRHIYQDEGPELAEEAYLAAKLLLNEHKDPGLTLEEQLSRQCVRFLSQIGEVVSGGQESELLRPTQELELAAKEFAETVRAQRGRTGTHTTFSLSVRLAVLAFEVWRRGDPSLTE